VAAGLLRLRLARDEVELGRLDQPIEAVLERDEPAERDLVVEVDEDRQVVHAPRRLLQDPPQRRVARQRRLHDFRDVRHRITAPSWARVAVNDSSAAFSVTLALRNERAAARTCDRIGCVRSMTWPASRGLPRPFAAPGGSVRSGPSSPLCPDAATSTAPPLLPGADGAGRTTAPAAAPASAKIPASTAHSTAVRPSPSRQDVPALTHAVYVPFAPRGKSADEAPTNGRNCGLFQDCLRRLLLSVGRVPVLAQDALDEHAELGAHVFTHRPVDGHVGTDGCSELASDAAQRVVAQHLHSAVVGLQRVVERELVIAEAHRLAAPVGSRICLASVISSSMSGSTNSWLQVSFIKPVESM